MRGMMLSLIVALAAAPGAAAQNVPVPAPAGTAASGTAIAVPPDYVIGPEDVLSVVFWKEQDMSAEVVVRPDGRIALPLLNDIPAAGLTPIQLRDRVAEAARKYLTDPAPTVVVKQINSRKVFITGQVEKPGSYLLVGPTTVVQLIATAGGLKEFAKSSKIIVVSTVPGGLQTARRFNYEDVRRGRGLWQNIELKPGDTVVVP